VKVSVLPCPLEFDFPDHVRDNSVQLDSLKARVSRRYELRISAFRPGTWAFALASIAKLLFPARSSGQNIRDCIEGTGTMALLHGGVSILCDIWQFLCHLVSSFL
jgi:hypothetical protein